MQIILRNRPGGPQLQRGLLARQLGRGRTDSLACVRLHVHICSLVLVFFLHVVSQRSCVNASC